MSNKTPAEPENATESARKPNLTRLLLGIALLAFGIFVVVTSVISLTDNKQRMLAPNGFMTIEIADTPDSRFTGLSNRDSLDSDTGLMFVFDKSSNNHCLVMRDMNFSIDMIWLNEQKEVITVTPDVSPETYPKVFCPSEPAKYALEINSGQAERYGITEDEQLRF